jgi:hypothetical protein
MLDVFNIAKPQNCDIQNFYGFGNQGTITDRNYMTWNKPRGVSHVYMLLIGGGGNGNGTFGGGCGAVTVWYGAAQNVPDSLAIYVRGANSNGYETVVAYRSSSGLVSLLTANSSSSTSGANLSPATSFASSGFYKSTDGIAGVSGNATPSATTFLSSGTTTATVTANYGYGYTSSTRLGYFIFQPIIVGVASGDNSSDRTAIGCGGSGNSTVGGPGFALIASW